MLPKLLTFEDYEEAIPDLHENGIDFSGTCPKCGSSEFRVKIYGPEDIGPSCPTKGCDHWTIEAAVRARLKPGSNGNGSHAEAERPPLPEPPQTRQKGKEAKPTLKRFELLSFAELCDLPPPEYQVEDFFMEQSFVQVFGETNHGKSLLVFDLICANCRGYETWFGRQILKPGPAVWVNADGGRGLTLRAQAWAEANGAEMKYPLYTLMGSVGLNKPEEMTAFRMQLAELPEKPTIIVFDTQSRCMPGGDENDQGVMTAVTEYLHRLRMELGCTVILIHHTDKTGQWERGSGVVKNETDTQIRVTKDEPSGIFTVSCRKARDGCPFKDFYFTLQPVGESVVIVQSETGPEKAEKKVSKRDQMVQIILNEPGITCEMCSERLEVSLRTAQRYADELKQLKVIVEADLPRPEGQRGSAQRGLFPNPGHSTTAFDDSVVE